MKLASEMDGPKRVTILVESPEHARQLQRHLRGWTMGCAVHGPRGRPTASPGTGCIVTAAFAKTPGRPTDVVIRADGDALTDDRTAPLVIEITDEGLEPPWRRQAALVAPREPFPNPWGGLDNVDEVTPVRTVGWLAEQDVAPARLAGLEDTREQEGSEGAGRDAPQIPPAPDGLVEAPGGIPG